MKCLVAAALCLASVPALAAGDGPFCVYSSGGQASCFYYTIDSCRMAAKSLNGMCAPNNTTQIQQAPQPQHRQPATPQPSIMGMMQSIQAQGDAGRQRGMEQREFEARMSILRAQQQAAEQANDRRSGFQQQADNNSRRSDQYLAEAALMPGMHTLANGVQYRIVAPGNGSHPTPLSTVALQVEGPFPWGIRPTPERPAQAMPSINVSAIELRAIRELMPLMSEGAVWEITLPPDKAFGADPNSPFPPNVAVVFRVGLEAIL